MDYSSLRAEARKRLTGKWGKVALITLVMVAISGLLGMIPNIAKAKAITTMSVWGVTVPVEVIKDTPISVILTLAVEIVSLVLAFGTVLALWKLYNGEDVNVFDGVKLAISNWKRALMILVNIIKKLLIPAILIVASVILNLIGIIPVVSAILAIVGLIWGFIEGLYYAISFVVAADNPNMSESDVVSRSKELMTNRRGKYVVLILTFIGWCILGALSFGIGMLWVTPYMQCATFAFYENCKGGIASTPVAKEEVKDEDPIKEQ